MFRVKRYAHGKYKFLVRWKTLGRWRRRYFATEDEAIAFARLQNARPHENGDASSQPNGAPEEMEHTSPRLAVRSPPGRPGFIRDFSKLLSPDFLGPRIERYIGDSWCMHLPFGYDLMRELAPKVFVELGVKQGESYFSFCQSAAENKINVRCYGVDSWLGDIQTGELDPEIQREVEAYNGRYSSFSELKPTLFAEALKDFPDATIDLLHIDGTHTYGDVKTDFESWLPKLSPGGIILFHDVMLRDHGFGVWKLWEEITRGHDSFLFEFGCGLGVWKKETVTFSDSLFVRRLFSGDESERRDINEFYANAAGALSLWQKTQKHSHPGALGPQHPASPGAEIPADERPVISTISRTPWSKLAPSPASCLPNCINLTKRSAAAARA
jgi:cephalosporin hydroxylase